MKVIAYLGFTLLSILIQFCVMDLTQEKNSSISEHVQLNTTNYKEGFKELLKTFTQKPHALYYRTQVNSKLKESNIESSTKASDTKSDQGIDTTTISTNTVIDELYDENSSTTEDAFTTESLFTSTEFDNVTEVSLFDKKNQSTIKPVTPRKIGSKDCNCNLLYEICDINCCCDSDCSDSERKLFVSCKDIMKKNEDILDLCYPYQYFSRGEQDNIIDNLFCIAKMNLPERRNISPKQYDTTAVDRAYKWHKLHRAKHTEFKRKPYAYSDPVWVLKEGSIWYIDIPSPTINNYCSGRKPILFLNNINVKCIVNTKDLEMFQILHTSKEAPCISVTEKSLNATGLNCSTLHCTNWTTIVCNDFECMDYNKSKHEPFCTEKRCTNLALKLEYFFYYYDSKIINATIKLHVEDVATYFPHMTQEINVKFVLTNESIDKITEISGSPGYIPGRPVISSTAETNRSHNFFNATLAARKYMVHPNNKNGICAFSQTNPEFVLFGTNKRMKCRFVYDKTVRSDNSTNTCNEIESNIEKVLGLANKTFVSPYGNPLDIKDTAWLPVHINLYEKEITYGHFAHKNSKLQCFNMITRILYIFTYADVSEMKSMKTYKIVSANVSATTRNVTFNVDDASTVLTIDISFIDGTKPRTYEYAAGPYINVHLPSDFFFPFRSNGSRVDKCQGVILALVILCIGK